MGLINEEDVVTSSHLDTLRAAQIQSQRDSVAGSFVLMLIALETRTELAPD